MVMSWLLDRFLSAIFSSLVKFPELEDRLSRDFISRPIIFKNVAIPWLVLRAGYRDEGFFSEDLGVVLVIFMGGVSPWYRRESKSMISIRSLGSFSCSRAFKLSKACRSLAVRQPPYSGLSFSNMLLSNNLHANKWRSLIASNLSNLLVGQNERPIDKTEISSWVREWEERLIILSSQDKIGAFKVVLQSEGQKSSPGS